MNRPAQGQGSCASEKGFTLIELLISIGLLLVVMGGIYGLLIENGRINRSQQMAAEAHNNARNCLSMVVAKLRSAGWDPWEDGFASVTLDSNPSDGISEITLYANYDNDSATDDYDEDINIRHTADRIEWRRQAGAAYEILAVNISNDADGDSTVEDLFTPDSVTDPSMITVQITAQSPIRDPRTGDFIRYTVSSDVMLRGAQ